jgi:hypothetical protein
MWACSQSTSCGWAFLASLFLACKFMQDKWITQYSNQAWAKLSGLPPWEIGRCEHALSSHLAPRIFWCLVPITGLWQQCKNSTAENCRGPQWIERGNEMSGNPRGPDMWGSVAESKCVMLGRPSRAPGLHLVILIQAEAGVPVANKVTKCDWLRAQKKWQTFVFHKPSNLECCT